MSARQETSTVLQTGSVHVKKGVDVGFHAFGGGINPAPPFHKKPNRTRRPDRKDSHLCAHKGRSPAK
jgi:hypothetical protein